MSAKDEDDKQRARRIEGMLMDALHAMKSMDQVAELEKTSGADGVVLTPPGDTPPADDEESLLGRIAGLTESALRFAARSTDTSLRVGRTLINSQDQLRMMLAAGKSLKDIREVAGLTLTEMSEALNLRDKTILEAIENGTNTLSFELILRLAALIARNDPVPFILRTTRNYNPEVWQILNDWGVGRLPLQFEREREFINIFRRHDDARNLSDEGFRKVLEFTRQSFEMSRHFIEEQERETADLKARLEQQTGQDPEQAKSKTSASKASRTTRKQR